MHRHNLSTSVRFTEQTYEEGIGRDHERISLVTGHAELGLWASRSVHGSD